jgi:small subunit ribosomal protein S16
MGGTHMPYYRIVVADARDSRESKVIDTLGNYNPLTSPHTVNIDAEKAKHWLSVGAQPTDTVRYLFIQKEVIPAPAHRAPAKTPKVKEKK